MEEKLLKNSPLYSVDTEPSSAVDQRQFLAAGPMRWSDLLVKKGPVLDGNSVRKTVH